MDLLLLFNLLLGSLLVFPYLSKGETVVLEMPDYAVIGTELKIKCSYSNFKEVLVLLLMENGNQRVKVGYNVADSIDQGKAVYTIITPNSGMNLEIEEGTSLTKGAFTFDLSRIQCKDFTSYTCETEYGIKSNEKTLQVRPGIGSITSNTMELSVHQVYTFTCRGTVSLEGPFDVKWYRRTITQSNNLQTQQQAQIMSKNECSRSVQSQLSYNVTESDVPNLILWCRINGGQSVEAKKNFTVQGETVVLEMPDYAVIGTKLKIKCSYSNFELLLTLSLRENGYERVTVLYRIMDSVDQGKAVYTIITPNSGINLVIEEGTTTKNGAFTFVLPRIQCKDFTSYTCVTIDGIKSNEKTLRVLPRIVFISSNAMELSVHQVYTFTCRGTVSKDGPFSVQWYGSTISQPKRLIPTQQVQILSDNDCGISVESQLSYNVTEADVPIFTMWCRIESGRSVENKRTFIVQGFKNSATNYESKTLAMAFSCIFFFLVLFTLFD